MSARIRRLMMILMAIAGALLVWYVIYHDPAAPTASEETAEAVKTGLSGNTPAAVAMDTRRTAGATEEIAPSQTTSAKANTHVPVNQRIEELAAAADRGDDWAACEVAAELSRCRNTLHGHTRSQERDLQRRVVDDAISAPQRDAILVALDSLRQRQEECLLVTDERTSALQDHLFQAADAGNTHAMAEFAMGNSTSLAELVADPVSYARYHDNATAFFEQAFQAGEPQAALMIMSLNMDPSSVYGGILPRAWRNPELVSAFRRRVIGELDQSFLSSDQLPPPAAMSQADDLYDRYFAKSPAMARFIASGKQAMQATRGELPPEWIIAEMNSLDDEHCDELKP